MTLMDVQAFSSQVNCQITNEKLDEAFQEANRRNTGELSFDEFTSLYHNLIFDDNVTDNLLFNSGVFIFYSNIELKKNNIRCSRHTLEIILPMVRHLNRKKFKHLSFRTNTEIRSFKTLKN